MSISLDKAFGLHPIGMELRAKRAEVISGNIANSDTPGYKAKGINFEQAFAQATQKQAASSGMSRTHEKHMDTRISINNNVDFRVPNQPDTGDGNTVDVQLERNLYLSNSMEYQASVQFLTGKIKSLKKAITGQGS